MNNPLLLFCGGRAFDGLGNPKPLMKIIKDQPLIIYFLRYLEKQNSKLPSSIILLCDEGQQKMYEDVISGITYPVPIKILSCGMCASTFEKFNFAVGTFSKEDAILQFGYPDIFFFGEHSYPDKKSIISSASIFISAAPLTSRFPRLIVDIYTNEVRGISNYSSQVPANPMHVFGGDIWGKASELMSLILEFNSDKLIKSPSLEYDFFFWLVNHKKMKCVMLYGDRIWVDSLRDVNNLILKLGDESK